LTYFFSFLTTISVPGGLHPRHFNVNILKGLSKNRYRIFAEEPECKELLGKPRRIAGSEIRVVFVKACNFWDIMLCSYPK
jgi:hypothetical protein